jgi:hypothetical protein
MAVLAAAPSASGSALAASGPEDQDAAAVMTVARDICLPLLRGGKIEAVAKATGLKNGRDSWVLPISGRRRIEVDPPGGANPTVCTATIIHDPGSGPSILAALTAWSAMQTPPLSALKTEEKAKGSLYQLTTSVWEGQIAGGDLAVAYAEDKTLDGKPVAGTFDQATLSVGLTPSPR